MPPEPLLLAVAVPAPVIRRAERVPDQVRAVAIRLVRLLSVLGDACGIVSIAFLFPIVILALGIPIALLVRLLLWLVSALFALAHLG